LLGFPIFYLNYLISGMRRFVKDTDKSMFDDKIKVEF
jgi:hypothetical protein